MHFIHNLDPLLKGPHNGVMFWKGPLINKCYPVHGDPLSDSTVKIKPTFLSASDCKWNAGVSLISFNFLSSYLHACLPYWAICSMRSGPPSFSHRKTSLQWTATVSSIDKEWSCLQDEHKMIWCLVIQSGNNLVYLLLFSLRTSLLWMESCRRGFEINQWCLSWTV